MAGYKGKRVIFATHALEQARARGVSQEDILKTLESPDIEYPSATCQGRRVLRKRLSSTYEVTVVIAPPGSTQVVGVITAWPNQREKGTP